MLSIYHFILRMQQHRPSQKKYHVVLSNHVTGIIHCYVLTVQRWHVTRRRTVLSIISMSSFLYFCCTIKSHKNEIQQMFVTKKSNDCRNVVFLNLINRFCILISLHTSNLGSVLREMLEDFEYLSIYYIIIIQDKYP